MGPLSKQYRKISRILYTAMSPSISAATKTTIVIVSKTGTLSECIVDPKNGNGTTIDELTVLLSKKCGFRNPNGFSCYHTWRYRNKHKYSFGVDVPKHIFVDLWAKTDGRAGEENKYDLPPPVDDLLIFGSMALVARIDKEQAVNLTIELWTKIYEKLFGGFEDLSATAVEDNNEIDELASIPACKKTSSGYLKDGFVVEDDGDTPRGGGKLTRRGRSKKSKSESTESEFITETETESGTPPSDSPDVSDPEAGGIDAAVEVEPPPVNKIVAKRNDKPKRAIKKPGTSKSKKAAEETSIEQEMESELSEESYD
jgi:hypothetical protein